MYIFLFKPVVNSLHIYGLIKVNLTQLDECLELLDAMEIGFNLSDYEQETNERTEENFN
ncbi:hypothetical protein [Vibrio pectenicida]|uniref:hypothetical protein n=1 Tax=Vibrio pectenicida TaxID=62763 RepID=UPI0026D97A6D